jgi:protein-disulfide isomerase
MPCIVAFVILSIIGIFSASHRKLAREAWDCVFRRLTLKPCDTGFDTKVKSKILGKLLTKSPQVARFVSRRFEVLSWALMLVMLVSTGYFVRGFYNFYAWGHCDGPDSSGFCVFDPTGASGELSVLETACSVEGQSSKELTAAAITTDQYVSLNATSEDEIIFIGCYSCEYTRATYPKVVEMARERGVDFRYVNFPVHQSADYLAKYDYCATTTNPELYYDWVDNLFDWPLEAISVELKVRELMVGMGFEMELIDSCIEAEETKAEVNRRQNEIEHTGIYGTPTVFVEGTAVVGPKPLRVYERLLRGTWY